MTYQVLSSSDLSTCTASQYSVKLNSQSDSYTNIPNHLCESQDAAPLAQLSGQTLTQCTSFCKAQGAISFRMNNNECYCFSNECNTLMLNKLKGTSSNNWNSYRFDCTF